MKRFVFLLIALLMLLAFPARASASGETEELFTLNTRSDVAVTILFNTESPPVSFTGPGGEVIDGEELRSEEGEGWILYHIPDAAPGTWSITYDRLSNTFFEVHYTTGMAPFNISSFRRGQISRGEMPVSFRVDSASRQGYHFGLYAEMFDNSGRMISQRLIAGGSASMNENVSLSIDTGGFFDNYRHRLRLDVWQRRGAEEAFDSAVADGSFYVTGNAQGDPSPDFRSEVNLTAGILRIDWSRVTQPVDALILVFDDETDPREPMFIAEYAAGNNNAEVNFGPETAYLRVEFALRREDSIFPANVREILINNDIATIWTNAAETSNSSQALIEYDIVTAIAADIIVGGVSGTADLAGRGRFSVQLPEAVNEVEIRYRLDDPLVVYVDTFRFIVDRTPPVLRLLERRNAITVRTPGYILAGLAEPGATVRIGGETAAVGDDGAFVHALSLDMGENIITVTVTCATGVVTAQDVVITRLPDLQSLPVVEDDILDVILKYLPLTAAFFVATIVMISMLLIFRGFDRAENKRLYTLEKTRSVSIVLGVLVVGGFAFFSFQYATVRSLTIDEGFFAIANESVDMAYGTLMDVELYGRLPVILGIVFGVLFLAIVFLGVWVNAIRNPRLQPVYIPPEERRTSFIGSSEIVYSAPPELMFEVKEPEEQGAGGREQGAGNGGQGTGAGGQGAGVRGQGAGSREQGAEDRGQGDESNS